MAKKCSIFVSLFQVLLVNHHQHLLGNWNIFTLTGKELELAEDANGFISIMLTFFQLRGVVLELWIWMADRSSSIMALILVCPLKRMWKFLQTATVRLFVCWTT